MGNSTSGQRRIAVLVVGQSPPPFHGQAIAIEHLVNAEMDGVDIVFLRMEFSGTVDEVGRFRVGKLRHLVSLIYKSIRELTKDRDLVLYYPPGAKLVPILRDMIFLGFVRPFARSTIFHYHAGGGSDFVRSRWWLKPLATRLYGGANAAIHLDRSATPDGEYFGAKNIFFVPNGIDVPIVERSRDENESTLQVLFVGLLSRTKGTHLLIETAKNLKSRGLRFRFHVVGEWPSDKERQACLRLIARYGLVDDIVFRGRLTGEAKWREYANADLFYFPTYYEFELMPLVVIEAMAYSLPVVASRWRCIPDVVVDNTTGYLFPPKDVSAAAELILKLGGDRELRTRLGKAAHARYVDNYTLQRHLGAMRSVFAHIALHE